MLCPFIESYGFAADNEEAVVMCDKLCDQLRNAGINGVGHVDEQPKLLDKVVTLNDVTNSQLTELFLDNTFWHF